MFVYIPTIIAMFDPSIQGQMSNQMGQGQMGNVPQVMGPGVNQVNAITSSMVNNPQSNAQNQRINQQILQQQQLAMGNPMNAVPQIPPGVNPQGQMMNNFGPPNISSPTSPMNKLSACAATKNTVILLVAFFI